MFYRIAKRTRELRVVSNDNRMCKPRIMISAITLVPKYARRPGFRLPLFVFGTIEQKRNA
jgi:hypothetical protein